MGLLLVLTFAWTASGNQEIGTRGAEGKTTGLFREVSLSVELTTVHSLLFRFGSAV